ncbi:MAG TPA: YraN family protein [Candidatus Paceibacterota bacterium]
MIVNKIGKLGEDLAALFIKRRGYLVLYRNYWKPYGEIDIVCQKQNKLYFIEVKSVSREISDENNAGMEVTRENYGAEENVHEHKLKRLGRVIQVFLSEKQFSDADWQFDVCVVEIDKQSKKARIKMIENQLIPDYRS